MNIDLQTSTIKPLRHTFAHVARQLGEDKPASRYDEATLGAQSTANFHYRPTWDPQYDIFDPARSAIVLTDWQVLKDPRQFYYASWTMTRARQQDVMEANFHFVESKGIAAALPEVLRRQALQVLLPLRHVAWGANMNNTAICAYGYGAVFTAPAMFHAMDNLAVAQYLTRIGLALDDPSVLEAGKRCWLDDPDWQPLRQLVEDSLVVADPFELFVAQNFALDGLLYPLIYRQFVDHRLALQGASAIAMLTAFMPEWHAESARWVDAVLKTAAGQSAANQRQIVEWIETWSLRAREALLPIARLALGNDGETALESVHQALNIRSARAGIVS